MNASRLRGNLGFVVGGLLTVLLIVLVSAGYRHVPDFGTKDGKTEHYDMLVTHNETLTPHNLLDDINKPYPAKQTSHLCMHTIDP